MRFHTGGQNLTLTWSVRVALTSKVESRTPSWDITRAGCPILVTFSFAALSGTGRANRRSRMLSTERLEAPQTRTRLALEFEVLAEVNWRMISIRVWVFPVPNFTSRMHQWCGIKTYLGAHVCTLPPVIPSKTWPPFSGCHSRCHRKKKDFRWVVAMQVVS